MAPLPESRLPLQSPPFSNTGVDYFGPMQVKRGRGTEKRWVCLFTCLTTRAIHLELVASLETNSFILALRRFASRRGSPLTMTSDNGTNFRGADRELKEAVAALDHTNIADTLATKGIKWNFNPPEGPHFGGVWERLVRSVKTTLRVILGNSTYREDVLHTALTEAESIINSRPLTALSDSPVDYEALSPNHFLIGSQNPQTPPDVPAPNHLNYRKYWQHAQILADHFWQRFQKEYLPELQRRHKWTTSKRNLRPNDLVLVPSDDQPRCQWKLGRIIKTLPGKDNKVRVVEIRTSAGVYTRPVAKLCLLEEATDPNV